MLLSSYPVVCTSVRVAFSFVANSQFCGVVSTLLLTQLMTPRLVLPRLLLFYSSQFNTLGLLLRWRWARTHTHTHTHTPYAVCMCVWDGGLVKSVISSIMTCCACCVFVVLVRIHNNLGSQYFWFSKLVYETCSQHYALNIQLVLLYISLEKKGILEIFLLLTTCRYWKCHCQECSL